MSKVAKFNPFGIELTERQEKIYTLAAKINTAKWKKEEEKVAKEKYIEVCLKAGLCPECGSFVRYRLISTGGLFGTHDPLWECSNCDFKKLRYRQE